MGLAGVIIVTELLLRARVFVRPMCTLFSDRSLQFFVGAFVGEKSGTNPASGGEREEMLLQSKYDLDQTPE